MDVEHWDQIKKVKVFADDFLYSGQHFPFLSLPLEGAKALILPGTALQNSSENKSSYQ